MEKNFFQLPDGKMWSPKSVTKIFPLQQNTIKIFGCKMENSGHQNQNEEKVFGAAMVNKIKYKHTNYLYTYH